MATTSKKKTNKKKGTTSPAVVKPGESLPVVFEGYGDFEGKGFQNQTQEDIAIPFINLLQSMSPEVDADDGIAGAKPGLYFNSVTQEIKETFQFVAAITQHVFVQWKKRDNGGGIVATHQLHDEVVKAAKKASTKFGTYETPGADGQMDDLIETYYVFGVLVDDGAPLGMATMAFTSTKIKSYKAIMGRLNSFQIQLEDGRRINPPLFAHLLEFDVQKQKNDKGTFYVPVIRPATDNDVKASLLDPKSLSFLMAAECEKLVDSGTAKADLSTAESRGKDAADADEDMPF